MYLSFPGIARFIYSPGFILTISLLVAGSRMDAQNVTTQHNDLKRTGWNNRETQLTKNNVSGGGFGRIFVRPVDDQIYGQPLVINQAEIGGGTHNIVIVATVNNSVYAFDADDSATMAPYWQTNLTYNPGGTNNYRPIRNSDMEGACGGNYQDFSGNMGIVGTPVIDTVLKRIYLVSRSVSNGSPRDFVQYLHALDLITGVDVVAPVLINTNGYPIPFDLQIHNQRSALLLYQGVVYISWASHCDWGPYHGWMIGYDAGTLAQKYIYNSTPSGNLGGIWMSGQGPAVDDDGFIYLTTGNGTTGIGPGVVDSTNRGESLVKLSTSSGNLKIADYFTPSDYDYLNQQDLDYGVDGVLLLPNTHLSLSGSKESYLYLIDNTAMQGMVSNNSNVKQLLDVNANFNGEKHIHGSPVYFQSGSGKEYVYAWAESGLLKQFPFNRTTMQFDVLNTIVGNTVLPQGMPGAMMSVSSNGTIPGTGILWTSHPSNGDANHAVVPGIIQAFDADDVSHELWNSNFNGLRDAVGKFAKFVPPTIANGKVYLATFSHALIVYGLNAPSASHCPNPLPAPWISADIGYTEKPGDVCYQDGQFTITASGDDIWNTADAFHSVFQPVLGSDVDITARVMSIDNTNIWAKCGVMFRSNLDHGSAQVMMAMTPGAGAAFQYRNSQNGLSANTSLAGLHVPYWVRIISRGNTYTGYVSADSLSWTTVDSVTIALGNHPYVGLAYTSHDNNTLGTAVVDHVSVVLHQDSLSVDLLSFTGQNRNNQYSQLDWATAKELGFDHFEIEHSLTNSDFAKIGSVAGQGDSPFEQDYTYNDLSPAEGINYYRLKLIDKAGHFSYSKVITVSFSLGIIEIYPNPAHYQVTLRNNLNFTHGENMEVALINPLGQQLFTQTYATAGLALIPVNFPVGMANGVYFLKATNARGQKQAWKIQIRN